MRPTTDDVCQSRHRQMTVSVHLSHLLGKRSVQVSIRVSRSSNQLFFDIRYFRNNFGSNRFACTIQCHHRPRVGACCRVSFAKSLWGEQRNGDTRVHVCCDLCYGYKYGHCGLVTSVDFRRPTQKHVRLLRPKSQRPNKTVFQWITLMCHLSLTANDVRGYQDKKSTLHCQYTPRQMNKLQLFCVLGREKSE